MSNTIQQAKDRLLLLVLVGHLAVIILYSLLSTHLHAALPGVVAQIFAAIIYRLRPGTLFSRSALAINLLIFSATLIHLSHGLIEMHFHVFAVLTLLSIYYDWQVVVIAGAFISLHHLVGLIIPLYEVFAPNPNLLIYLLHILFVALVSSILAYQSRAINRSVSTINQSSHVLVEQDLPQLLNYLQRVSNGDLNGIIEFKAKTVPILAADELGNLSRLYNELVLSCRSISATTSGLGLGLRSILLSSHESVEHIKNLSARLAKTVEHKNDAILEAILHIPDSKADYSLREQVELASTKMMLAAAKLDKLQTQFEAKLLEQTSLNNQLEELIQRKSRFFASLSHELRTPLTSILLGIELLAYQAKDNLSADQLENVGQITQSALNMRQLIGDILDFSKMEASKLTIHPEKIELAEAFNKACREVAVLAANKNLAVLQQVEDYAVVLADPKRLHQILLNLLSNAIKFTPANGKINLTTRSLQYNGKAWLQADDARWQHEYLFPPVNLPAGKWVALQVSDNGIGIPHEQIPVIFNEFEQVEDKRHFAHSGTGLGLPIVKRLVELMDGQVFVESYENYGSTFTVLLPAFQETDKPNIITLPTGTLTAQVISKW